jgi:hypothetical protein
MHKQYLRRKPFWYAAFPIPWWIVFIAIIIGLIFLMGYTEIPIHLETRV